MTRAPCCGGIRRTQRQPGTPRCWGYVLSSFVLSSHRAASSRSVSRNLAYREKLTPGALYSFLRRLNLERHTVLPWTSADAHSSPITLEQYLDVLAKQNYLEKVSCVGSGQLTTDEAQARRRRRTGRGDRVAVGLARGRILRDRGGRVHPETVSLLATTTLADTSFLGESDDEDESEDEQPGPSRRTRGAANGDHQTPAQRRAARRIAKRQRIQNDLERAAGGPLTGEL